MEAQTVRQDEVDDRGLIAAGYLTAFLVPIVGTLVAGYLYLRGQARHAAICLAISIAATAAAYLVLVADEGATDPGRSANSAALQRYQSCLAAHAQPECRAIFPAQLRGDS